MLVLALVFILLTELTGIKLLCSKLKASVTSFMTNLIPVILDDLVDCCDPNCNFHHLKNLTLYAASF